MKPKTLQIDIWQFVRIMVEAETHSNGAILLKNYADIWQDMDATLWQMANTDMEKYAELMMETSVTLNGVNRDIADCIMEMASEVIGKLTNTLDDTDDEIMQQDYAFEIHGLEQLVDEISG